MKNLAIALLLCLLSLGSFAQPHKDKQEDWELYKAKRVSYMTEKMQLTPEEAQKFWPIYNEFDKARWECHEKRRSLEREVKDNYSSISEADSKKMNEEIVGLYLKESQLVKTYNDQFLKVLPAKKVILVGPTEDEFRFKMIREFRQKREEEDKK